MEVETLSKRMAKVEATRLLVHRIAERQVVTLQKTLAKVGHCTSD